jgi:3-deoxy-D-manno-octulosonic acid (KDO) 8-phosphate synthase
MDIEGAERTLLQQGLPPSVRHLFLEWHQDPEESHSLQPSDLIKGDWRKVSRDLYGSSMWYLRR